MSQKASLPKGSTASLSLLAQLDDCFRYANSVLDFEDEQEDRLIELVKKCEDNRIKWLFTTRQLIESENQRKRLEEETETLKNEIKRLRHGFANTLKAKEDFRKQANCLTQQLNAIREFVLKDTNCLTKDNVLSYIHLETITEEQDSDLSTTGIEYDKSTEENLLDYTVLNRKSTDETQNERQSIGSHSSREGRNRSQSDPTFIKENIDSRKAIKSDSDAIVKKTEEEPQLRMPLPQYTSSPQMSSNRFRSGFLSAIPENEVKAPFEERPHKFVQKKAFKPVKCGVCDASIGFFGAYLACEVCKGICHTSCRDRLPVPCIEYRKRNTKGCNNTLIADFAPPIRPMVPPLIIHCCQEIEKRGLKEEGIYRKTGCDHTIRELVHKLRKPKSGIPSLESYDIHVLSNVVKRFLRELDEPIVTRILWRDFVRASDQKDPEEERRLIIQTVEQLPTTNSDSLAYLINHLLQVLKNFESNLMDSKCLAKVFGPTLIGYSSIDPPTEQLMAEHSIQIRVMEALLRVPEEVWNRMLHSAEMSSTVSARNSSLNHRTSRFSTGPLTPQRGVRGSGVTNDFMTITPMF